MRKLCTLLGVLALGCAPAVALARGNPHGSPSRASNTSSGQAASHAQGNAGTSGTYSSPQPPSRADQNPGGANGGCPGTTKGDYCSTRNGSLSMNGNGNGRAYGKPCAGCVGRADNKNPHGQYPNGSDHNNGYECDGNHGIGRTNPAHTGCSTTPTPTQTPTPPPCPGGGAATGPCSPGTPPPSQCSGGGMGSGSCTPPSTCESGGMSPGTCSSSAPTAGATPTTPTGGPSPSGAVGGVSTTRPRHGRRAAPSTGPGAPSTGPAKASVRPTHAVFVSSTKPASAASSATSGSGSLPFTGLDVGAVVLAGGLLIGLGLLHQRLSKALR